MPAGSNSLAFFASGTTERMRLDSSGNLGIGTNSPSTYGNVVLIRSQNSDTRMWIRNEDAGSSARCSYVVNASGNSWSMGMGSTANNGNALTWLTDVGGGNNEMMRLTTSGNLGIGTSSPLTKLVVSNGGAQGFEFVPASGILQVYNRSTSAYGSFICDGSLFAWRPSGAEAMRLDTSGNLGIGTTAPVNKLSVLGLISASDSNFTASAYIHASPDSGANRNIGQFSVAGASNGLQINWDHASSKMHIIINNIPTSSAGLPGGTLYSDGGTIKIA
jgi:hypothetical protein